MNKAALGMLAEKSCVTNTDEQQYTNFSEHFDVDESMFVRVRLPSENNNSESGGNEYSDDSEANINQEKFDDTVKSYSLQEITN